MIDLRLNAIRRMWEYTTKGSKRLNAAPTPDFELSY